jgi:predicted transcriptional regulator
MSNPDTGAGKANVKTLAIRLEPEVHAQLSVIAQLRDSTISDEIRTAIEAHITATKTTPELAQRGQAVLDEIERDAATRRGAIASLFGGDASGAEAPKSRKAQRESAPQP